MAYKQYTSCVDPDHYVIDFGTHLQGYATVLLMLVTLGFGAFIIITVAGGPVGITIAIAALTGAILLLEWYLHGRLICLGDDPRNCAIIGMVDGHGPSDPSLTHKFGDNDYTMNILLAPGPLDFDEAKQDYWAPPQGHLVAENAAILSIGKGYPQGGGDLNHLKALHCEFEGDGIRK